MVQFSENSRRFISDGHTWIYTARVTSAICRTNVSIFIKSRLFEIQAITVAIRATIVWGLAHFALLNNLRYNHTSKSNGPKKSGVLFKEGFQVGRIYPRADKCGLMASYSIRRHAFVDMHAVTDRPFT